MTHTKAFFMTVTASMLFGAVAVADPTPAPAPAPAPVEQKDDIWGKCHFKGVGKGKEEIHCKARFKFDRSDLYDRGPGFMNDRDRDFLEIECSGTEIYEGGIRVRVRGHEDLTLDRREIDVIFAGRGEGAPRIFVNDLNLRDRERCDNDATLWYSIPKVGEYKLQGECEFESERGRHPNL